MSRNDFIVDILHLVHVLSWLRVDDALHDALHDGVQFGRVHGFDPFLKEQEIHENVPISDGLLYGVLLRDVSDVPPLPTELDWDPERREGLAEGGEPIEDAANTPGDNAPRSLQQGWGGCRGGRGLLRRCRGLRGGWSCGCCRGARSG